MMNYSIRRYTQIALFNFLLIAVIGLLLRYKIAFYLPFVDQKYLLHGHSHFAFSGWVTHSIFVLLVRYLQSQTSVHIFKRYKWIINANLLTAYGMLVSFPLQGYGVFSIIFSTLNIFVSYAFVVFYWKDLNRLANKHVGHWWLKSALAFNALSSAGAFSLAFMMATGNLHQQWYLASVYFFLHFQYNGWFFFACMGLATLKFFINVPPKALKQIFWLFALACVPAYLLSALWLPIPWWLFGIVVLAAILQLAGWLFLIYHIKKQLVFIRSVSPGGTLWILLLCSLALTIKLFLQAGSTVPALSKIAFGFRPIVIGYLHLVLLGVISLFLVGFMMGEKMIPVSAAAKRAVIVFVSGVILNEVLLMLQGVAALTLTTIPLINEMLFLAAVVIFSGLLFLNLCKKTIN